MTNRGRGTSAREEWDAEATSFSAKLKKHLPDVCVLLLGPGYPPDQLETRKSLANRLRGAGCQVFIMEELGPVTAIDINTKFEGILDRINPDVIVALFTKQGSPHAVIFEVGFLCGHLGIENALKKLRFCIDRKLRKVDVLPRYFDYLMAKAEYYEFCDGIEGRTLYDRVFSIIQDEVVRKHKI
ncbi:MAG: hypothetical protein C4K49_02090 [Candidatus Thorarchaeota archaeon]|nr:MAG: hypothetical protein C4K49_02090 [Candidatus Thorarchaeota archaeon]